MGAAIGYATLPVIPSARGFAKRLQKEIGNPTAKVGAEVGAKLGAALGTTAGRAATKGLADGVARGAENGARRSAPAMVSRLSAAVADGTGRGLLAARARHVPAFAAALGRAVRNSVGDVLGRVRGVSGRFTGDLLRGLALVARGAREVVRKFAAGAAAVGRRLLDAARTFAAALGNVARTVIPDLLRAFSGVVIKGAKLVGVAQALPPLLLLAGGAAGALTTALTGGVASVFALRLGMRGVGDALSEVSEEGKASSETLKKLSKNARKFVHAFEGLQKPLRKLQRAVQNKLFAGLDKSLKNLAGKWLPALKPALGGLADNFNSLAKNIFAALGKPDFIKNIRAALFGFGVFIDRLGAAAEPFIDSIGRLAKAAAPVLAEMGDNLARVVERFSKWVADGEKTGKLKSFMDGAVQAFRDIRGIGGAAIGIAKEIYTIFFPDTGKTSEGFLGTIRGALEKLRAWLADPENKQKIRDFIDGVKEFGISLGKLAADFMDVRRSIQDFGDTLDDLNRRISFWSTVTRNSFENVSLAAQVASGAITGAMNALLAPIRNTGSAFTQLQRTIAGQLTTALGIVGRFPGAVVSALGGLGGMLYAAGRNAIAGFANGMRSNQGLVVGAGRAIASAAAAAVTRTLDIHSPSRVFARLGAFVGEGMALGIDRSRPRVTKAVGALVAVPDVASKRPAPAAAPGPVLAPVINMHNTQATAAQVAAVLQRQAILARTGRAR